MTSPVTAPTTAVKSTVITNLDASPMVRTTAGFGAQAPLVRVQSTMTPTASQATSVLMRFCRVPSNAIIQRVAIILDAAATTLTGNVGVWFSDVADGTGLLNQGNLTAISSAFFCSALAMATFAYVPGTDPANVVGLSAPVDITFANSGGAFTDGQYLPSESINPLWKAIADNLALQTTPVGPFTNASKSTPDFTTASAGGSVFVRSTDPGGFFDIGLQLTSTGSSANVKTTMIVDYYKQS